MGITELERSTSHALALQVAVQRLNDLLIGTKAMNLDISMHSRTGSKLLLGLADGELVIDIKVKL